jgi:hypothetical protein
MPSRKSMGPLSRQPTSGSMDPGLAAGSPTPIVREAERPDPYRLLPPEPWNIRRDKEPSRRAFIVVRPLSELSAINAVPFRCFAVSQFVLLGSVMRFHTHEIHESVRSAMSISLAY